MTNGDTPQRSFNGKRGLSLLEVVISLFLVALILVVSLSSSANLIRQQRVELESLEGKRLASSFIDEISSVHFEDDGEPTFGLEDGESSSNRQAFDDVDDYHGYRASPPTTRNGLPFPGFDGWSVEIVIAPAEPDVAGISTSNASADSPFRLVRVRCTAPSGGQLEVQFLISSTSRGPRNHVAREHWHSLRLSFADRDVLVTTPLRNRPRAAE